MLHGNRNFRGTKVVFEQMVFIGAVFIGAVFTGAVFTGAVFTGAQPMQTPDFSHTAVRPALLQRDGGYLSAWPCGDVTLGLEDCFDRGSLAAFHRSAYRGVEFMFVVDPQRF